MATQISIGYTYLSKESCLPRNHTVDSVDGRIPAPMRPFFFENRFSYLLVAVEFLPSTIWVVFPKIGVPQNRWFIRENPIKMDDLGVPLFLETSICISNIENGQPNDRKPLKH